MSFIKISIIMITESLITILILLVAIISFFLFTIGILSYRRKKDIRLLSVSLAFFTFFVKNLVTSIAYQFNIIHHGDLELFGAIFDLIAMILLLIPIFKKTPKQE